MILTIPPIYMDLTKMNLEFYNAIVHSSKIETFSIGEQSVDIFTFLLPIFCRVKRHGHIYIHITEIIFHSGCKIKSISNAKSNDGKKIFS